MTGDAEVTGTFGPPSLIASDVDGTLLDDNDRITERTRDVLIRAREAGTELVLATGRPPRWVDPISDQLAGTPAALRYAVCANGAVLFDVADRRVLRVSALAPDVLEHLAAMVLAELPGCGLAAERAPGDDVDAATPTFVATAGYEHAWLNPDHVEIDDHQVWEHPAIKLLARVPGMASEEMARRVAPLAGDLAEVTFSTDNGLIELSLPGVHKASGLADLMALTGLPRGATVAFGDMPNDVEMLRQVAHGVAMGHGHPAALAAADEVTASNADDGVARVLERWF